MDDGRVRERYGELEQYFRDNNVFYVILGDMLPKKVTEYSADNTTEIIVIPDAVPYGPIEAQGAGPLYILLSRPKTLSIADIKQKFVDTLGAGYKPHLDTDFDWLIGWMINVACTDEEHLLPANK